MTNTQAILKELQAMRANYTETTKRLEELQTRNINLTNEVKILSEKTESQVIYTAMMTDTIPEVVK